jgi:hypothetical protein
MGLWDIITGKTGAANSGANPQKSWTDFIPVVGPILGGIINSATIGHASGIQQNAANNANSLQVPFRDAGVSSLAQLQDLLKPGGSLATGPQNVQMDPGYQFRLAEMQKGVERSQAARTGTLNPAATKAMADYTGNMASAEYGNAWNRQHQNQSDLFSRLSTLAGMGEGATANMGANTMNAGQAQAGANVAQGANWGNAIAGAANNYQGMNVLATLKQLLEEEKKKRTTPYSWGAGG